MRRIFTLAAVALLASAGLARAQVPASQAIQTLDTWYRHYLGRPLDQAGADYWYPKVTTQDPRQVLAALLAGDEYNQRNGGTPQGLVIGLYRDVLGRSNPTPTDIQQWINVLSQSSTRQDMIVQFLNGVDVFNPPVTAVPTPGAPLLPGYPATYVPPYIPPTSTVAVPQPGVVGVPTLRLWHRHRRDRDRYWHDPYRD